MADLVGPYAPHLMESPPLTLRGRCGPFRGTIPR